MHHLDKAILELFKKKQGKELTTSEVVKEIFPEESKSFNSFASNTIYIGGENKVKSSIRRKRTLLHKRLLYHLNKLVDKNILKLSGIEEFGEKRFSLSANFADVIIEDKTSKIVIRNNVNPVTPIDGYESQKIVKKIYSNHWINKLDAIVLNSKKFGSLTKLYDTLLDLFQEINDVVALSNFEFLLQKHEIDLEDFLNKLASDCKNYGKNLSFLVDCEEIHDKNKLINFVKLFADINYSSLQIVFELAESNLNYFNDVFKVIIELFSEKNIKINIKNKDLCNSPVFFGNAGVYSFHEADWKLYKKEYEDKLLGLSCSSSSLIIDVQEFFNKYNHAHDFREFILNANKALLIANIQKRKIAYHYFRVIHNLNRPYSQKFFTFERNYIRFWNYNFQLFNEKTFLLRLLKSVKEQTDLFSLNEETIYKSCGMPTRFKMCFSSGFRKTDLTMTQRAYLKSSVKDSSYFDDAENIKYLKKREKLLKIFDNSDRIRFFRTKVNDYKQIINEFSLIMQNFKFPFFTYDFARIKGNTKLTNYFK
jgi:hypothetical protein